MRLVSFFVWSPYFNTYQDDQEINRGVFGNLQAGALLTAAVTRGCYSLANGS